MGRAKDIILRPIAASDANRMVKRWHYSGKVVPNSQLHLGAFLDGRCGGVMQFGPSLFKRKLIGLVRGTLWNEFIELNRMAFADWLPRNSESRCIGVAMRMLRASYPWLKWVVSFADATQCGDGTIYRASGFVLTGVKESSDLWVLPDGKTIVGMAVRAHRGTREIHEALGDRRFETLTRGGSSSSGVLRECGATLAQGHQLRYIYFLHRGERENLTVPVLPFSVIDEAGARMYLGKRAATDETDSSDQEEQAGQNRPGRSNTNAEVTHGDEAQ